MVSPDFSKIVLIKKNKPKWQEGLLKGVGGKIELIDKNPKETMVREFQEETGVTTLPIDWFCFHIESFLQRIEQTKSNVGVKVYFMLCISDKFKTVQNKTDEEIIITDSEDLIDFSNKKFIYNLPYIWLMALTCLRRNIFFHLNPEGVNYNVG